MQKLTNLIVDHPAASGLTTAALIVVFGLFVYGLGDVRRLVPRRIWALGGVVFAESIRRKVLWLTPLAMLGVVVLSALQRPDDAQDAIRQTLQFCLFASGFLVIVSGIMLACTNLPRDIESKVVFTIVTKPTTRLEIVLGKVVGFARVTGAILVLMGVFTWGYLHFRAWQLEGDIAQQLAGPLENEVSRNRLEHQRQNGLLATRTISDARNLEVVARRPSGPEDVRWASTKQTLVVPFETTAAQFVPKGVMLADGSEPPPGSLGVEVQLRVVADQVGKVEHAQPAVRAPLLAAASPTTNPYGQPEFRLSIVDLASGTEIVAPQAINGGKPIEVAPELVGKPMGFVIDEKAAPALANSRAWGVTIAPTNENFLIGMKPGSVAVRVPGATPDQFVTLKPATSADGKTPMLMARGGMGRSGQMLDGPQDEQQPFAIFHFDSGNTPAVDAHGDVALEMSMGIDRLGDDASAENTQVDVTVANLDDGGKTSPVFRLYPENGKRVYADLPVEFFRGGHFDVILQTHTDGHAVALTDNAVGVVQARHSFAINLAKAMLSQWLLSTLVVTIGFFCSTFVSWPIAIVLSVVLLMGRWTVDQVSDSLQPGIGALVATDSGLTDPTRARVVSATVDGLARMLNVVAQFLPNIDLFSTGGLIERGLAIPLSVLLGSATVLVLFALPLLTLAYARLRNMEVAP